MGIKSENIYPPHMVAQLTHFPYYFRFEKNSLGLAM